MGEGVLPEGETEDERDRQKETHHRLREGKQTTEEWWRIKEVFQKVSQQIGVVRLLSQKKKKKKQSSVRAPNEVSI